MEIGEFLLARIAEDEAVALAATTGPWRDSGTVLAGVITESYDTVAACNSDDWGGGEYSYPATPEESANASHIARWDPARALAECEAKRRIVGEHVTIRAAYPGTTIETDPCCKTCSAGGEYPGEFPCQTLRLLTLPYVDHPDYDGEWSLLASI